MIILIITFLLLVFSSLSAERNYISLEDSVERAIEFNKSIGAESYKRNAADWAVRGARSNFLPSVDLNISAIRLDNDTYNKGSDIFRIPVLGGDDQPTGHYVPMSTGLMSGVLYRTTYRNNISLNQPVFNGGKMYAAYQMSRFNRDLSCLQKQDKTNEIVMKVIGVYYEILRIKRMGSLLRNSINTSTINKENAENRYQQGLVKQSDVMQWQVRINDLNTDLLVVEQNLDLLLSYFRDLLNLDYLVYPVDFNFDQIIEEVENFAQMDADFTDEIIDNYIGKIKLQNLDVLKLQKQEKILDMQTILARSNFLPSLNLQFSYEFEPTNKIRFDQDTSWTLAAVLSFPLFRGGSNIAEYYQARFEKRAFEKGREVAYEHLSRQAKNIYFRLITASKSVLNNLYSHELALENHRIIQSLFRENMVINSEMLDAELMLNSSEINLINSYYDYIISKYELEDMINQLLDNFGRDE